MESFKTIMNSSIRKILLERSKTPEEKYQEYIDEHIKNVNKAYQYIKENLYDEVFPKLEISENQMDKRIKEHDTSKFSEKEFYGYADHFFGSQKDKENDPEFKKAWKHHYQNNKHHPEYWGYHKEMPFSYILELICDWWSFSWKKNKLDDIKEYWDRTKKDNDTIMGKKTKETVDWFINLILKSIKEK